MIYVSVLVLFLQLSVIQPAPIQLQLLQPFQNMLSMQPQLSMQQQMIALQQIQQLQTMQRFNEMQSPLMPNPTRPLLILLPNSQESNQASTKTVFNDRYQNLNENEQKQSDRIHEVEDGDDSIIIDAEDTMKFQPKRSILLIPNNGRFSIGGFISSIPFLPFEINVPDSISWIYNGIAGIIGGIGQRLPFRPQKITGQDQANLRINLDKFQEAQNSLPFLVTPLDGSMLPM